MFQSGSFFALALIIEIIIFAVLAKKIHQGFYTFFYKLTSSATVASKLFALLFLPGTFIHELSHFVMAKLLFVHATKLELIPIFHDDGLKLGSVSIAKTDPVRRILIGAAPFIFGLSLILGSLFWIIANLSQALELSWWQILLIIFAYFEIGNTMFSSRKDMEGSFIILSVIVITLIVCYLLNWLQPFEWFILFLNQNKSFFMTICGLMIAPLIINFCLVVFLKLFRSS